MQASDSKSIVNDPRLEEPGGVASDDREEAEVGRHEPQAESVEPSRNKTLARLRAGILIAMLLAGAGLGVKPAYNWWHARQSRFYDEACEEAAEQESWEQLESIATQWVKWDPNASRGWIHLADAKLRQDDVPAAVDALGRVQDSYQGALEALAIRGDILFSDLNQPYEAMDTWERMLRINENATVARQRMIYFYAMTMQRERMKEEIYRAIELGGEPPEAYTYLYLAYDINFSDGMRLSQKWLQSYPDDETLEVASAIYRAAFEYDETISLMESNPFAGGDFSEVERLREIYPHNIELLAFFLQAAVFEGSTSKVVELLKDAPAEAESDPRFWRARGWYLLETGRVDEAETALRTALKLDVFDWKARILLSASLRRLGRVEAAEEESRLGLVGKELHQDLFELPNARSLGEDLAGRISLFCREVGELTLHEAIERRAGQWMEQ